MSTVTKAAATAKRTTIYAWESYMVNGLQFINVVGDMRANANYFERETFNALHLWAGNLLKEYALQNVTFGNFATLRAAISKAYRANEDYDVVQACIARETRRVRSSAVVSAQVGNA